MLPWKKMITHPTRYTKFIKFETIVSWPFNLLLFFINFMVAKLAIIIIILFVLNCLLTIIFYWLDFKDRHNKNSAMKYWK